MSALDHTPLLTPAQRDLLQSFGLSARQKRELWEAWCLAPDEVEFLALTAKAKGTNGEISSPAALLLTMIRRGDHLQPRETTRGRRVTGWRWVRGTHSGTYVRDPAGTDPLPPGYGLDG